MQHPTCKACARAGDGKACSRHNDSDWRNPKNRVNAYERITQTVCELLENGVVPWRQPWKTRLACPQGVPRNGASGRPYRGMNSLLLGCADYDSAAWVTYKQARALGGHVRAGEQGWPVTYWQFKADTPGDDGDEDKATRRAPLVRTYSVFNVRQCEGLPAWVDQAPMVPQFSPIESCERIATRDDGSLPPIVWGHPIAAYYPEADKVKMPLKGAFDSSEACYHVLFHELAHATGHPDRLKRKTGAKAHRFGSSDYGREELVAELAAAMTCQVVGIDPLVESTAAYCDAWLKVLRDNPREIVTAGAMAQKAADWIVGDSVPMVEVERGESLPRGEVDSSGFVIV